MTQQNNPVSLESRRAFMTTLAGLVPLRRLLASQPPLPDARLVGTVELGDPSGAPVPPFGTLLGTGLDARLFTDLSTLESDRLTIANDKFFVRTAFPATIDIANRGLFGWDKERRRDPSRSMP